MHNNISNKKLDLICSSCKIAFTYVGTVIGAGFASGQEVLSFFTAYGRYSALGIFISTLLFILVGKKVLLLGYKLNIKSFGEFVDIIFGSFSKIINAYLLFAFAVICTAMFSGAGTLFVENKIGTFWIGAVLTAIITIITILFGMHGVLIINSIVVPLIILFNIITFLFSLISYKTGAILIEPVYPNIVQPIASGIVYASFNLILCVGVLAAMGNTINNVKALRLGGVIGGCILGFLLLISNYALYLSGPGVYEYEIPILFIVQQRGKVFRMIFSFIVWCAIFTTSVGNTFPIISTLNKRLSISYTKGAILITAILLYFSQFGFANIVSWLYPIIGIIGYVFIGVILLSK